MLSLDGRNIGDSTAIIAAVEEYRPEPPLYPEDAVLRTRALDLEDFFDEQLAPALRRFGWHHTLPDEEATRVAVIPNAGSAQTRAMRVIGPVMRFGVRKDYDVNEASGPPWTGWRARSSPADISWGKASPSRISRRRRCSRRCWPHPGASTRRRRCRRRFWRYARSSRRARAAPG